MKHLHTFESFINESQLDESLLAELNEMRFTSAGVKELLTAIYYNWEKLKKSLKDEMYFNSFKDILDFMKTADQEEQSELESFVTSHGIELVKLDY